jgi:hypothetical protein
VSKRNYSPAFQRPSLPLPSGNDVMVVLCVLPIYIYNICLFPYGHWPMEIEDLSNLRPFDQSHCTGYYPVSVSLNKFLHTGGHPPVVLVLLKPASGLSSCIPSECCLTFFADEQGAPVLTQHESTVSITVLSLERPSY